MQQIIFPFRVMKLLGVQKLLLSKQQVADTNYIRLSQQFLYSAVIEDAYRLLNDTDVVIGPAKDGGYYLLGIKNLHQCLFKNVSWSTSQVLKQTLSICRSQHLNYSLLPTLTDIDDENDLSFEQKKLFKLKKGNQ